MNAADLSVAEAGQRLRAKDLSSAELLQACLERVGKSELGTFLFVDEPGARAAAEVSDQRRQKGESLGPLDGIPIGLKDLLVTEGLPTTAASKILKGWRPPYDGAMSRRLKAAGAVIVGKTNMDEFAMGSSSEHSAFEVCRNPWDLTRVPGGSSGGSAAAVAAGQVLASLGTDTGGSIRQPASFCGVYGLKPTYGRVSRSGVIAFASSLDQVGPLGRSARDIGLLMNVISGFDPEDSTSAPEPVPDFSADLDQGVQDLRIGLPAQYFGGDDGSVDSDVETTVRSAIGKLEAQGAQTLELELPHSSHALSTYYLLCTAEASSNLARYDGVRYGHRADERELRRMYAKSRFEGFGEEVRRRIILGTFVLSAGYREAYYERAQRVRTLIRQDFAKAFDSVDLLASPVAPTPAFPLGEKLANPLAMYQADILTLAVNLAGVPAISVPAGFSKDGLPVGLQLIAPWFQEERLLHAAAALEQASDAFMARPDYPPASP